MSSTPIIITIKRPLDIGMSEGFKDSFLPSILPKLDSRQPAH